MARQPHTLTDRIALGRASRKQLQRSEHDDIGHVHRDPLALLRANSAGRVEGLVPLRYGRMLASPFTFFRGSAILQAHDLGSSASTGLCVQLCGDAHLSNFGGFATPERNLIFDLNDFDETHPGPWEWDVKRLAASLVVASRHLRHGEAAAQEAAYTAVASYQQRMAEYAQLGMLEVWYERITFERLLKVVDAPEARKRVKAGMSKAGGRTHEQLLPKLGNEKHGQWTIRDAPPAVFHIHGSSTLFGAEDDWLRLGSGDAIIGKLYKDYVGTLSANYRQLLSQFARHDMAFKVVGVGSVGTRCLIALMVDAQGKPLFLQFKEARRSVLADYVKVKSPYQHEGRRVVDGQRLMQAASDIFLGWTSGPSGRHFYGRQLRDMKLSADIELYDAHLLKEYGKVCGWVLARAHAKASGMAPEISGYIGSNDSFAEAVARYAARYADQVERDFEHFAKACRSGKVEARTDQDYAADFTV
ncbi:Uncharacterized conserved protein, DUF2252 family [Andreprevotia lacus DSM 23236]|jgi:uncharacterized protein (DUF2252 family)|uniref:Uncharacterized conserved protein, DUF2252 family n=1 Tax=Andreprevotia lacus DSM 23236 TaxID=1121001 RepID=A0A1W1XNG1_9NEIS|nr:DUF2252 domain-containing protein [Andreprevotia lacus]SMC25503.1 Uncharacterized conserved protein, DUF2252 family [Andreprevotia lacus DSM 23236]